MKKTISFILSAILLSTAFTGCGKEKGKDQAATTTAATEDNSAAVRAEKYSSAVKALADDELEADGTYTMSEDLVIALENATFTQPKNVIYMIGDGMGFSQIEGAEAYYSDKLYEGKMAWRYLPMVSSQSTSSSSDLVTDSAAGGTALSTGYRTSNGTVAMDEQYSENFKTVLELAAEKGKSTGIIATKNVTDATPASFTAHVTSRAEEGEIASQQADKLVDGSLDLVLGGGAKYYDKNRDKITEALSDAGVTYTKDFSEAKDAALPLVGLFNDEELVTTDADAPTLAEMTDIALDKLSEDENGFFIMIEGSQIDSYGHDSDLEGQMYEMYQFDCAIAVALRFAAMNPDTVIIITADHETGGLIIPDAPSKDNVKDGSKYTSDGSHTQANVPVLAIGHGTDTLSGINHNTDCAIFVASVLGEKDFGQSKTVSTLLDADAADNISAVAEANPGMATAADGAVSVSFGGENDSLIMPVDAFDTPMKNIKNARTVVITMTNKGEAVTTAPILRLTAPRTEVEVEALACTIDAGETVVVTYPLPFECWNTGRLMFLSEMALGYADGTAATLEIGDMFITERPLGR
ncbi:MAG: alkaline phosphatase [Ruminococcaceae bacterium]|nr:alkaline phosphatase [Oscillospiraceae bacterium]